MKLRRIAIACGVVFACGMGAFSIATGHAPIERHSVWSIAVASIKTPFDLATVAEQIEPALTYKDVNDVHARFVADPFLVRHNDQWTMFFEVLNEATDQGDIGCATSPNGSEWKYEKIVLDEPFHLSYPNVFRHDGDFYMVPESEAADGVRLYRATSFPHEWTFEQELISGEDLADPTIFQHNRRWYMFVGKAWTHDELRLLTAEALKGPWKEHPSSPLIENDPKRSRPAGPVTTIGGKKYRFAQDCSRRYGEAVLAFEITKLTPDCYEEAPAAISILGAQNKQWNSHGMHHLHALQTPAGWVCCVDGHRKRWVWGWARD